MKNFKKSNFHGYLPFAIISELGSICMSMIKMRTFSAKHNEVERAWFVVDAEDKILGRLASEIAKRLRGKHKPEYTPHVDTGDYIIVINAEKINVTGRKRTDKIYHHHSGYPGGLKSISFEKLIQKAPCRVIELAVKRMLPRGPLGRAMFRKLKVYAGPEHQHSAQQPIPLTL
jgi:large subunit ribosomal protein L13